MSSSPVLVEEYPREFTMTLFEKIIMASKRAKDLHLGKIPLVSSLHKEPYQAILEIREGMIDLVYRDEDETDSDKLKSSDAEDEA